MEILSKDFWTKFIVLTENWVLTELPGIVILVVGTLVLLRVTKFTFDKLRKTLISRAATPDIFDSLESEKRINTLIGILQKLIKILVLAMCFVILLGKFGVNIGPILASAGIMGLAIGFGAQELVRDFISGFFLLLENQIRTGDVAIINGTGGQVEKIELRTITLRDFAGVVHIFQNGKINTLSNMTKEWSAVVFDIGVAYKEDVDRVIDIMKAVGKELQEDVDFKDKIIEPIEVVGLDNFADSALVIKARFKTQPIQQWNVGREYRKRLKKSFDLNNIEIPFPHTTVYWGDEINPLKLDVNKNIQDPVLRN